MKIYELDLYHGKSNRKKPIFCISIFNEYIATGSIDGELKIWKNYESFQELNDHSGSIMCLKFNNDKNILISTGDDGNICIYKLKDKFTLIKKILAHKSDITSLIYKKDIITGSLDGKACFFDSITFTKIRELDIKEPIRGMSLSPDGSVFVVQSESNLFVYKDYIEIKTINNIFEEDIYECFFSRMSWSPDSKYLAVGLSFNNHENSVEIINRNYESLYSLIGHIAPVEVIAFAPFIFKKEDVNYYIIAVASQDKSLSIWASSNYKPIILLKNFTQQPILDMMWNKTTLYTCSYDGSVNIVEFFDEFGATDGQIIDDTITIPFNLLNIEIDKYKNKIENLKEKNDLTDDFKEYKSIKSQLEHELNQKDLETKSIEPEIKPKKKRIKPILLENKENKDVLETNINSYFSIFKSKSPNFNSKVPKTFEKTIEEFKIKINENQLVIYRDEVQLYKINVDNIISFCANREYLVINSRLIEKNESELSLTFIYKLESGILILPTITSPLIIAMDLKNHNLLLVDSTKRFKIIDILKNKTKIDDYILDGTLLNIYFDKKYFLISLYESGTYFYNKNLKVWMKKYRNFDSKFTEEIDFEESVDEDMLKSNNIEDLEYKFLICYTINDLNGMLKVTEKLIKFGMKYNFTEIDEYKYENILTKLLYFGCKREVITFLEELNGNDSIQPFVCRMIRKIKDNEF